MNTGLVLAVVVGATAGAIVGPVLGYWSVRWQDVLERHRTYCVFCRRREARRQAQARPRARHSRGRGERKGSSAWPERWRRRTP